MAGTFGGARHFKYQIKITQNGEIYLYMYEYNTSSFTNRPTSILAIRKTQNTIATANTENFATKDDIANLINSILEGEY